jgi:hypothetical protein
LQDAPSLVVRFQAVLFRDNQFSSVHVQEERLALLERQVLGLRYVLESDGRCILRGNRQPALVPWVLALGCRLLALRVPEHALVHRHDVRASVMFLAV